MSRSRSTTQWLLLFAGACGVFGLLLKVTDFYGPAEPAAPVAPRDGRSVRRAKDPGAGGAGSQGLAPGAEGSGEDGVTRGGGREAGEPLDGIRRSGPEDWVGGRAGTGGASGKPSPRALERRARLQAKREARAARRAALRAARVGQEPGGLPGVGGGNLGGPGGVGQPVAGGKAANPAEPGTAPPVTAGADVVFDSGLGTQYATNAQIEVPDVDKLVGRAGTISFWMEPQWGEGNQDDASLVALGDNRLQIIKNVNFLRFELTDDAGAQVGLGAPITDWKAGEWHQVTTTWDGRVYSLYLDGRLVSQTVHDATFSVAQGSKMYIGSDYPESRPVAPGMIGNVDVRNRPLAPGEIANQYNQASNQANAR